MGWLWIACLSWKILVYLALYRAERLAAQDKDTALRARFAPVARALGEKAAVIDAALIAVRARPESSFSRYPGTVSAHIPR